MNGLTQSLITQARQAADEILEHYYRLLPIQKSFDLSTPRGFDRAVARLSMELKQKASLHDKAAVKETIGVLDINWMLLREDHEKVLQKVHTGELCNADSIADKFRNLPQDS